MSEQSYYIKDIKGLPIIHINESDRLNYYLKLNKYDAPFIKCYMYSELKDINDQGSIYTLVQFTAVEFKDISDNSFIIRQLLMLGIRYLVFFGSDKNYVVNAIACNDESILKELLDNKNFMITDAPVLYPVKIHDLKEVQDDLYNRLIGT